MEEYSSKAGQCHAGEGPVKAGPGAWQENEGEAMPIRQKKISDTLNKLLKIFLIIISFGSISLKASTSVKPGLFLYDHMAKEPYVKVTEILPNRIYLKKRSELKTWFYVKSNDQGIIKEPLEAIGVGSVVYGHDVGVNSYEQHFALNAEGGFVQTRNPVKYRYLVFGKQLDRWDVEYVAYEQLVLKKGTPTHE